ncbi:MAG TPA: hypothetical protein VFO01_18910 [Trebonia sp.]|nr:hypothetical protein [Trebonia sp.]
MTGEARYAEAVERTLHDALLGVLQPKGHWRACSLELEGRTALSICRYPEIKTTCCVMSGFLMPALDRPPHEPAGKLIWLAGQQDGPVDFGIPGCRLSPPLQVENRSRSYCPKELRTWRFADFASLASPGTADEAAYRVWFPQPTLDR